ITIGLAAISLFLLLLIDAKSFAIAAFAALGLFTLFRSFPSVLATIAVVIPALPPAITLSKDFLWLSFLDQRKSYYGMFTGREHIWDGFWAVWLKADDFHRFFGYGLLGQNTSGMYLKYKDMFTDYQTITKTTATLHNSYLQILADTGIFGLTINMLLLWVLVRTAAAWAKNGEESNVWGAFTVLTISLAIAAGTEVALTVYMRESFALYIFLIVAVLTLRSAKRENAGRASIRRP
ncbi:O-antigen ligase family protein, partial [Dactylosporangium matsuzakiense]